MRILSRVGLDQYHNPINSPKVSIPLVLDTSGNKVRYLNYLNYTLSKTTRRQIILLRKVRNLTDILNKKNV